MVGGQMVFGEGKPRGILFVGESPGRFEEQEGRPFVGPSGDLFRKILTKYNIKTHYIMNLVLCRSCVPLVDDNGQPIFTRGWGSRPPEPRYKDQPPTKAQIDACAPRFYEEIYMADPIVIVALGQPAAAALRGGSIKITKERGIPEGIEIPGAGRKPSLSAKKKEWARKVKGVLQMPIEQSKVKYLMIPTLHPAYVVRNLHDQSTGNPFEYFSMDILLAKQIYDRYNLELYGITPEAYEDEVPYEIMEELRRDFDDERNEG